MMNTPYQFNDKLSVLYQDRGIIIAQTLAGEFDKQNSQDLYGQFNMGLHVADCSQTVLNHRSQLLIWLNELTNQRIDSLYWLNQIHSDKIEQAENIKHIFATCADSLITSQDRVGLAIMTADCVPIALFNHEHIACIHAGWQGLTNGIIAKTVKKFTHKDNIKAVVGACISQDNYEVDTKLAYHIIQECCSQNLVECSQTQLYECLVKQGQRADKCYLDIVALTHLQLKKLNIFPVNTIVSCTYAQKELYSYRAQTHAKKQHTGRMATVIAKIS